jgi:hypothetical protein
MKLIIAGSRTLEPTLGFINSAIRMFEITNIKEIVSGTANGVDQEGEHWASHYGAEVKRFPANWEKFGKPAGHIRNKEMAKYADALLLIWDGESKGSFNMKQNMEKLGKPIYEVILKTDFEKTPHPYNDGL